MTPEQALVELQKELATNSRIVGLLTTVVEHQQRDAVNRSARENDHAMLIRFSERVASLKHLLTLITARVPTDRT